MSLSTTSRRRTRHGTVPLSSGFILIISLLFSVLFILAVCLVFVNSDAGHAFRRGLDEVAEIRPGIVLVGENVDVDVDEPSVTIRWSVLGCGTGFMLPDSPALHGTTACGLPAMVLNFYVDSAKDATFTYDPASVPTSPGSKQRSVIQALVQFDSDHVLDVHNTRLYPFDTYIVSTYLQVTTTGVSEEEVPVTLSSLPVLQQVSSFTIAAQDSLLLTGDELPARHLELRMERPGSARAYAMLLFSVNWFLCHFNLGIVILFAVKIFGGDGEGGGAPKEGKSKSAMKQLAGVLAVLLVIPQLRDAMPDAPGFDGVLIDIVGFFPQMTLAGLSTVLLMLLLAKRELDNSGDGSGSDESKADGRIVLTARMLEDRHHVHEPSLPCISNDTWLSKGRRYGTQARDTMVARAARAVEAGSQALLLGGSRASLSLNHYRSKSAKGNRYMA